VASGGSIQYSGEVSATVDASGSRSSLQEILGAMSNIDALPEVSKSEMNPDGGHTFSVTFPTSMRDVPQLEVYLTEVPVYVSTVEHANMLDGFFRLEYDGEITEPIPIDADAFQMQMSLSDLSSIGNVLVTRSEGDDQDGYTWTIQFVSDENSGNLDDLIVHSDNVSTTGSIGGASVAIAAGGTDGSFIGGTFAITFGKFPVEI